MTQPDAGDIVALIAEADAAARFYAERYTVDEQKRCPSLEEMSRREALEQADLLHRLADRLRAAIPTPEEGSSLQKMQIAQPSADAAGEWVLVPREPTEAMCYEGGFVSMNAPHFAREIYRAMLAASPSPTWGDEQVERLAKVAEEEAEIGDEHVYNWPDIIRAILGNSTVWRDEQIARAVTAFRGSLASYRRSGAREGEMVLYRPGEDEYAMRAALSALWENS